MKKLICFLVLALLPSLAAAQASFLRPVQLSSARCNATDKGVLYSIENATSVSSVASTGTTATIVQCDGSALRVVGWVSSSTLSAYAPLAGADFTGDLTVETEGTSFYVDNGGVFIGREAEVTTNGIEFSVNDTTNGHYADIYMDADDTYAFVNITADQVMLGACTNYGARSDYSTISGAAECDTFFDLTLHATCEYNGSAWVKVADGSTACTAS